MYDSIRLQKRRYHLVLRQGEHDLAAIGSTAATFVLHRHLSGSSLAILFGMVSYI